MRPLTTFVYDFFLLIDKIEEAGSPNEFRRRAGTMGEDKTTKDLTSNRLPTIIKVKVLICKWPTIYLGYLVLFPTYGGEGAIAFLFLEWLLWSKPWQWFRGGQKWTSSHIVFFSIIIRQNLNYIFKVQEPGYFSKVFLYYLTCMRKWLKSGF